MTRTGKLTAALAGLGTAALMAAPFIMKWEGLRTTPYRDPVGIATICYGHTGPDILPGQRYTLDECAALLAADIAIAQGHVQRCLPMDKPAHIEAALISATFNLGPRIVCGSTLQRLAQAGDWDGACAQLPRWNRGGGRVIRGLTLRRADERALCEGHLAFMHTP